MDNSIVQCFYFLFLILSQTQENVIIVQLIKHNPAGPLGIAGDS